MEYACWAVALCICASGQPAMAADEWSFAPYKILLTIAIDDSRRPEPGLEPELERAIADRVQSRMAPLWSLDLQPAADAASRRFCLQPDQPWPDLAAKYLATDKPLWLGVRVAPNGYVLSCREFDVYTQQWSPVQRRTVVQRALLDEACFDIVVDTFAPLAKISLIEGNASQVALTFKGSALPQRPAATQLVRKGDAYLPLLRRTGRAGAAVENAVTPVPWTYLTVDQPHESSHLATIHSGTRRPFGLTRARVEQIALAVRNPPGPTRVRFYARADKSQGLAGYEVFRQTDQGSSELVGITDRNGVIEAPTPAEGGVLMFLLRSEGQLLAKAPAPAGSPMVEIPIADSPSRLRAQGEAQVIREQLVDVVARRTIMAARIRALLKEGRVDDAREIMTELDSLPSATTFGRNIDAAAKKLPASNDPGVQRMIDNLFSSTRAMLGRFLDRREIIDLQSEVNAAQAGGS
jgi:hypothetical protein